jgi:hypothetical protein
MSRLAIVLQASWFGADRANGQSIVFHFVVPPGGFGISLTVEKAGHDSRRR